MRLQKIFQSKQLRSTSCPQLLLLCLCFICGALIGYFTQKTARPEINAELYDYLQQYADRYAHGSYTPVSFFRVLAVYFRYPLLAFCLGFCALGVYALPLLCAVQGFFLSFSVCCFGAAMGRAGIYMAFTAFGLRVLITLPCLLLLALQAYNRVRQAHRTIRQKSTRTNKAPGVSYFILPGICSVVLLFGAILEITFIPRIFQWVVDNIL